MKRVDWTGPSENDLQAIDDYWCTWSVERADEIQDRIRMAGDFLARLPEAGPALDAGEVRKWLVRGTDYLLLYRLVGTDIQILRVHHGREDWAKQS